MLYVRRTSVMTSLPTIGQSIPDWLNEPKMRSMSKSDLQSLSISLQLTSAELFQELELMESQLSRVALPALRSALGQMDSGTLSVPAVEKTTLDEKLESIRQLVRAKDNLDRVRARRAS